LQAEGLGFDPPILHHTYVDLKLASQQISQQSGCATGRGGLLRLDIQPETPVERSSSELVDELFKSRWPRLYLDTAELNDIGRGNLAAPLVDALLETLERHAVVLVISSAHMRDALKPGDVDAPKLFATTLERFWMRALVVRGPDEVEPWPTTPRDIELSPVGNVHAFLTAEAAQPALVKLEAAQDTMFVADIATKAVQRFTAQGTPKKKLSKNHEAIVVGSTYLLALGFESKADEAIDRCARTIKCALTDADRLTLLERVMPAELATVVLAPYLDAMDGDARSRFWSLLKAGPENAPGTWLARQLAANRIRNVMRAADRSDSIDLEHCAHFPYVDIATCDRQAYAAIEPHVEHARGPRPVRVFRNGRLEDVVQYIQSMPMHEDIRAMAIKSQQ
jgi:hypothetical protein